MPSTKSKTKPKPSLELTFEAIGTQWFIELFGLDRMPDGLSEAIQQRIAVYDKNYSRFRDDSLVAEMSRTAGNYLLPDDAQPLFDLYRRLYDLTSGAVTPLIGQVMVEAGYDASYSLQPKQLHQPPAWDEVLDYQYPNVHLKQPALLDVGAAGKGYLVDIVAGILEEFGATAYCVDAGGDMVCHGPQSLRVGLEHPDQPDEVIGIVELENHALCGSAGNRRKWANFHHIIDPKSLHSPVHLKAVWVLAESALLADGLATALFFVAPAKLMKHYTFSYVLVRADNSLEHSQPFPAEFFTGES